MSDAVADDLVLFARVVDAGSFSRAAERLQVEKSTVSRRIAALEERFGERLLLRSTRKLTLTDFGLSVLDYARVLAAELDGALALVQHRQAEPSGRLRVSLPSDFAAIAFPKMLAAFVQAYPSISLEMDCSPRHVDLIGENFDLAVRFGELSEEGQLTARKLADITMSLYASPAYLQKVGEPNEPDDLLDVHALLLVPAVGIVRGWTLRPRPPAASEKWSGTPRSYTTANSPLTLMRMAEEGFGVVGAADFTVRREVKEGTLKRVLPEWSLPAVQCKAVFPGRRLMPARTRVFLDALIAAMGGTADWT